MIQPAIGGGAFNGGQIARLFHDADERRLPLRIGADFAKLPFGKVEALPTVPHVPLDVFDRPRKPEGLFGGLLKDEMREAVGGFRSDAWESRKLLDQLLHGWRQTHAFNPSRLQG